jgi:hypothetical protein
MLFQRNNLDGELEFDTFTIPAGSLICTSTGSLNLFYTTPVGKLDKIEFNTGTYSDDGVLRLVEFETNQQIAIINSGLSSFKTSYPIAYAKNNQGGSSSFICKNGIITSTPILQITGNGLGDTTSGGDITLYYSDSNKKTTDGNILNGLYAWYKFEDDNATTVVVDSSLSGHNGTSSLNTSIFSAEGKIGNAFNFVAASALRVDTNTTLLPTAAGESFTLALWVKGSDFGVNACAIGQYTGADPLRTVLYFPGGVPTFWIGGTAYCSSSMGDISDDLWHHIILVKNGNALKMYTDGVDTSAGTQAYTGAIQDTDTFIGAGVDATLLFNGLIDDVRFYNRALSVSECVSLYNWRPI